MMSFLACKPLVGRIAAMMFEDMQFDGADSRAITWGDEIPAEVKAASPVVVIGCGESGILAGIRLSQAGLPFTIIDKNDGPGGTWWENRYPGARVDVGSHQYCYSFEPGDHWSEYYCEQPELRDYFDDVVEKYGLQQHCRFGTTVTAIAWDEAAAQWHVAVQRPDGATEVIDARFVISAVGSLNLPHIPEIPGMETFAGPSFHSARWPDDLDITGTRFALIGAGASGFQIAPTIADQVAQLTIYQRTAQWMFPNPVYRTTVPAGDRWALRHLPFYARWFRFMMTYPGIAVGTEPYRRDPDYDDGDGMAINEGNAARREAARGVDPLAPRRASRSDREVDPRLSRRWQAHPAGRRLLAADPCASPTSSWCAPASTASCPTASSPSTACIARPTSSATRPASGTTSSSRRWR